MNNQGISGTKISSESFIDEKKMEKYKRSEGLILTKGKTRIKNRVIKQKLKKKEDIKRNIPRQSARTELLLTEDSGFLEKEPGETTTQFRQSEISDNVDITSATKFFQLHLEFGPYVSKYSRNGRHLVIGGKKGHVAAFDWVTKKLACEMNVMESVYDVSWLHIETMFAVAQKDWVYVYDNQGIELHCLKRMNSVTHLEFLPYHFLLASAASTGCLSWLDISIGEIVSRYDSRLGRINTMTQNPTNAVLCVGDSKGVISMWSPSQQKCLAKMLCHRSAITACTVHPHGTYMATSSPDRAVKVWDVRQLAGPVHNVILPVAPQHLSYSQTGLLAVGMGNVVEVLRETNSELKKYTRHRTNWNLSSLQFCPYEDVLGFGNVKGFSSILVPGSAEANFDALEVNPFQTKKQRREAEVKALLEKIPSELITLDNNAIAEVDIPTLKQKVEEKKKLLFIKPKDIDFTPRKTKAKGKGGTAQVLKTKKALKQLARTEAIKEMKQNRDLLIGNKESKKKNKSFGVLDRFLPPNKK